MAFVMLGLIAILSAACSDSVRPWPTAPTPTTASVPPPPVLTAPPFPAVTKPARIYLAAKDPSHVDYHGGTIKVRYVLYDDLAFALQYTSARFGNFEYPGTYVERDGEVLFNFGSAMERFGATATITDQLLTVTYSAIMQQSDFEDAVFERVRGD